MLQTVIVMAPIAAAAYYSSLDAKAADVEKKAEPKKDWVTDNTWVYLQEPILASRSIPGDFMEYDQYNPTGPVQKAVSSEKNPIKALSILGDYSKRTDKETMNMWKDYVNPRKEVNIRYADRPVTLVNIMSPGSSIDKMITTGNKFYDQPVPRWTGTDRYHKRTVTLPYYHVP